MIFNHRSNRDVKKSINQTYRLENIIMATTSTNIKKKPILVIKSPENSSKSSSSRNVRFVPDIKINDEEVSLLRISSTSLSCFYFVL